MKLKILVIFLLMLAGCRDSRYEELVRAVDSRSTNVHGGLLPRPFTDAVAASKVLVLGEQHYVQEHHEFLASILPRLHQLGYRSLLLEDCHAFSWIAEDYVMGRINQIPWRLKAFHGYLLETVRQFNAPLPAGERIKVQAFDMNHHGSVDSIAWIRKMIDANDIFDGLTKTTTTAHYLKALNTLKIRLESEKESLEKRWTPQWFERVRELVEVELISAPIRIKYDDVTREDLMADLIDRRIAESPGNVVLNIGLSHAQKQHYRGWYSRAGYKPLGEDLPRKYRTYHVACFSTQGEKKSPSCYYGDCVKFNCLTEYSKTDLIRIMAEKAGGDIAILTLDEEAFSKWTTVCTTPTKPKTQFDAYVLYPRITVLQSLKEAEPRLVRRRK